MKLELLKFLGRNNIKSTMNSTKNKVIQASKVITPAGVKVFCEGPVRLIGPLTISKDIKIGAFTYIRGPAGIKDIQKIGRYCSIAPGLVAGEASHPKTWLSTSPFQYSGTKFKFSNFHKDFKFVRRTLEADASREKVAPIIGNDVWIGSNVVLLNGVTVGDGSIIGAGAVVTKSVDPYSIVAGVPAKVIGTRFNQELIDRFLRVQWWRFDAKDLSGVPFDDPAKALDVIEAWIAAGKIVERPVAYVKTSVNEVDEGGVKASGQQNARSPTDAGVAPKCRKIIISGFPCSGSSAILDFLAEREGVAVFPGGEFRLLRFSSVEKILGEIKKMGSASRRSLEVLLEEFSEGRRGGDDHGVKQVRSSIAKIRDKIPCEYERELARLAELIIGRDLALRDFIHSIRSFISNLCDIYAQKFHAHTVLLDQAVRPWELQYLRYFDECSVVISKRDVRDQMVDRSRASLSNEGFLNLMRTRMSKADSPPSWLGKKRLLKTVWFEDFVENSQTREDVLKFANMTHRDRVRDQFNPIASGRSVRVWRGCEGLYPAIDEHAEHLLYKGC